MSTFRAAKTIWDMKNGHVTNLAMQKLLYLAHMLELVRSGTPLVDRPFEAWDYGPVEPNLYHKLKAYGASEVPDIFFADPYRADDPEHASIKEVMNQVGGASPAKLVAITHREDGAWSRHYMPNMRNIVIPDNDILEEYKALVSRSQKRNGTPAC